MTDVHGAEHLLSVLALGVVAVLSILLIRNRVIRKRMLFTVLVLVAVTAVHVATEYRLFRMSAQTAARLLTAEKLLLALAVINGAVTLAFNPWFADRVRDRAPAIVQDALVIGLFLFAGMVFYQEDAKAFTASAIAAAVLGFALQETLGNAFAGLAIQTEKPFRVGHWVSVAGFEGRVAEVTWRATKIWTKAGNLVILPNNVVAREAINNYTEPAAPTRLFVEVGAAYATPPNEVREALFAAIARAPHVLAAPKPDVLTYDFAASAITYRVRFWIDDYSLDEVSKDGVRRAIYYEFARRGIEIPFPIQIEYSRQETTEAAASRIERFVGLIARVPVFSSLPIEGCRALAAGSIERLFGAGEVIVAEGAPGSSMFVVCKGRVSVTIEKGHEVARIAEGGYFGEMSLLTGEPRTATVSAAGDCSVLEISGAVFRDYVTAHPEVIDLLASPAAERRRELDQSRAAVAAIVTTSKHSLRDRMRKFFGLV
ncbi:MAG: mechanosensitive ion channel [Acidobacteria bacterium]|nr:mechanosensitive ion channel [Acidobacteriota bacterium]